MIALLAALPGRIWGWAAAIGAALAAGAWLLLAARAGGRDAERIAQAGRDREATHARMVEDGRAARADAVAELRRRWGRG